MSKPNQAKPTIYRPDFSILVDTREKAPWSFQAIPSTSERHPAPISVKTYYAALPEGDYQLNVPITKLVSIERKSLEDLFSTLGGHRERFEAEIERLNEYQFAAVLIEASLGEVMNPQAARPGWRSQLHPRSVFETISAWEIRYPNVHWIYGDSRRNAEIKAFSILQKAHKRLVEEERWEPVG